MREISDSGTGWYDQALSEVVLESLDFDEPIKDSKPWPWYCILGGSVQLANNMNKWLNNSATMKSGERVSKISGTSKRPRQIIRTTVGDI